MKLTMMRILVFSGLFSAHALLFFVSTYSFAQSQQLTLATYTYATNDRIQNLQPLAAWLRQRTGIEFKVVSYPTVRALIRAIKNDSVDIAMMNTSGYLVLQRNHAGKAIAFLNLDMGSARETNYCGCIIASKGSAIGSMHDVRSKDLTMALVASSSTSGNLVPRLLLNQSGIDNAENAMRVYYAGTHKQVVQDVLTGRADLGGVGCAEVEEARRTRAFDEQAVLVADFSNIPLGPVVYRAGMDAQLISKVEAELVRVHQLSPPIFSTFCAGWTEFKSAIRFKTVTDAEYDAFRQMFGGNHFLWTLIE